MPSSRSLPSTCCTGRPRVSAKLRTVQGRSRTTLFLRGAAVLEFPVRRSRRASRAGADSSSSTVRRLAVADRFRFNCRCSRPPSVAFIGRRGGSPRTALAGAILVFLFRQQVHDFGRVGGHGRLAGGLLAAGLPLLLLFADVLRQRLAPGLRGADRLRRKLDVGLLRRRLGRLLRRRLLDLRQRRQLDRRARPLRPRLVGPRLDRTVQSVDRPVRPSRSQGTDRAIRLRGRRLLLAGIALDRRRPVVATLQGPRRRIGRRQHGRGSQNAPARRPAAPRLPAAPRRQVTDPRQPAADRRRPRRPRLASARTPPPSRAVDQRPEEPLTGVPWARNRARRQSLPPASWRPASRAASPEREPFWKSARGRRGRRGARRGAKPGRDQPSPGPSALRGWLSRRPRRPSCHQRPNGP